MKAITEFVKTRRKQLKLTQEEFAMKAGVALMLSLAAEQNLNKDVAFLFYCDEEYDFKGMKEFIKKYKSSSNKNTIFYFSDTQSNPLYSYISLEGEKVVSIKEKIKIMNTYYQ